MERAEAVGETRQVLPRREALGIRVFIALDCTSFGLLFLVFMVERYQQAAQFDQWTRLLHTRLGFVNTLILITSSWLVARANHCGRDGDMAVTRRWLMAAAVVASGFGIIKTIEYVEIIGDNSAMLNNDFPTFYFALTGVHLMHYLIGMAVLVYLATQAAKVRTTVDKGRFVNRLDGGALFWHMVDLIWISLFPMLYLVGLR